MLSVLSAYIRRSLEGVKVDSERLREIEPDKIHFKDVVALFIRTWPYLRPMRWHATAYVSIAIFVFLWAATTGFIIYGMIYNNVILNLPVSSIAASILGLNPADWIQAETLSTEQRHTLLPMIVVTGVIAVGVGQVIGHANAYYRVWLMQNINQNLRLHLMSQLQSLSLKFHSEAKTGDAIYRLFQDSAMVTQILQALIVDPFLSGARFLIGLIVVSAFSPMLGLIMLITWIPLIYLGNKMSAPLRHGFQNARRINSMLTSSIQESIEGIRTIKVNGLEAYRQQMFEQHSVAAFSAAHDARVKLLLFGFYVFVCSAIPLVVIELRAAVNAYEQADTFFRDLLLAFGFAVWNFGGQDQARARAREAIANAEVLLNLWGKAQDMAMGLNRVYQILDLTPEIQNRKDAETLPGLKESIRFNKLSFSYPDRPVFEDISFTVKTGELIAILGPTGTGKTTLMMLLLRMYEYQGGSIEIDNRDIHDFTFESVRNNITLATQENILFSRSVMENIRYARPDATDEEVKEAARITCSDDFIMAMKDGYETFLGEKAAKLSTGQRQRLVIARAILKDTPILILDEPTASLDAQTERTIMDNIKVWAKNRTVFLITHRLSTVRQADKILYLKDGRVADFGNHQELMETDSDYQKFVTAELHAGDQD